MCRPHRGAARDHGVRSQTGAWVAVLTRPDGAVDLIDERPKQHDHYTFPTQPFSRLRTSP
jgi:hypothetical protein